MYINCFQGRFYETGLFYMQGNSNLMTAIIFHCNKYHAENGVSSLTKDVALDIFEYSNDL
jgi:hypothetical protein